VIHNNFGLVTPDIVEQVHHNPGRLVPYQFVISLVTVFRAEDGPGSGLTSENAGAAIFRYLFHSSPSEATMFRPKIHNAVYKPTGLGNLAREVTVVTSYERRLKTSASIVGRVDLL
jgi:hypothetical protein